MIRTNDERIAIIDLKFMIKREKCEPIDFLKQLQSRIVFFDVKEVMQLYRINKFTYTVWKKKLFGEYANLSPRRIRTFYEKSDMSEAYTDTFTYIRKFNCTTVYVRTDKGARHVFRKFPTVQDIDEWAEDNAIEFVSYLTMRHRIKSEAKSCLNKFLKELSDGKI